MTNVNRGLLERIDGVTAERLFAYEYGILAQPAYAFWDELEQPPPRLPITTMGDRGLGRASVTAHLW